MTTRTTTRKEHFTDLANLAGTALAIAIITVSIFQVWI